MLSLQTIVTSILVLVELLIIILQIIGLVECKQCLIFAKIFEVQRTLESGFSGWCYMVIANGFLSIFICLLTLTRRSILGIRFNRLKICYLIHINTFKLTIGLRSFQRSFL